MLVGSFRPRGCPPEPSASGKPFEIRMVRVGQRGGAGRGSSYQGQITSEICHANVGRLLVSQSGSPSSDSFVVVYLRLNLCSCWLK